jgi:hypothetical protein
MDQLAHCPTDLLIVFSPPTQTTTTEEQTTTTEVEVEDRQEAEGEPL